jgi:DNA polymerase IV
MIMHVDGDSFFASVETSLNPRLKGKPVVTGHERGIATAMSKEAKALGVHRGMPIFQIKKFYPQVIIVRSDYHHYRLYAQRMYAIARRWAEEVEEYSVDECFGLVSSVEAGRNIKRDLQKELGMTFSLGLAQTKVLAKVASKMGKPDGFTILTKREAIIEALRDMPVGLVWGIGPQTARQIEGLGVKTVLEFTQRREDWIQAHLGKRGLELWHELNGRETYDLHSNPDLELPGSIQHTRTFNPATNDLKIIFSELSQNVEGACAKARSEKLFAKKIYYFLKTQEFRYHRHEIVLPVAMQTPNLILNLIRRSLGQVHRPKTLYRATGVTLSDLVPDENLQNDLFGEVVKNSKTREIYKTVDKLDRRYGPETIILSSSLRSQTKKGGKIGFSKRFNLPYMGEVV